MTSAPFLFLPAADPTPALDLSARPEVEQLPQSRHPRPGSRIMEEPDSALLKVRSVTFGSLRSLCATVTDTDWILLEPSLGVFTQTGVVLMGPNYLPVKVVAAFAAADALRFADALIAAGEHLDRNECGNLVVNDACQLELSVPSSTTQRLMVGSYCTVRATAFGSGFQPNATVPQSEPVVLTLTRADIEPVAYAVRRLARRQLKTMKETS